MELLMNLNFKGISFDIIDESISNDCWHKFTIIIRTTNNSDKKKKIIFDSKYISQEFGLLDSRDMKPSGINYGDGRFLQPHSFVDVAICFDKLSQSLNGDRMELVINEGRVASLLLQKEEGKWFVIETKEKNSLDKDIKKLIEHFDGIDEKFGLTLQNFSVKVVDEFSLKLFCEVLALNGEGPEEGFNIEVAIYDTDSNIVYHSSISKYDDDFKGFEVFAFNSIQLDIPVDEIGKIRIYPTR